MLVSQHFHLLGTLLLTLFQVIFCESKQDQVQCWLVDSSRRSCSWSNSQSWSWVYPIFNGFQLDGPSYLPENMAALVANLSPANSTYSMSSPYLAKTKSISCFTFDYYILVDSTKSGGLKLYLVDAANNKEVEIWSMSGVSQDLWSTAHVNFDSQSQSRFQVSCFLFFNFFTFLFYH